MKLVAFTSFKGGAGKSTSLMSSVSGLVQAGKKVALFEADQNDPLSTWQTNARAIGTWDESCQIYDGSELDVFIPNMEKAEQNGCDIALVDMRGGDSELNTAIIANADLVLIPTSLTAMDIDGAISTFQFLLNFMEANEKDVPAAFLLTRVPTGRQSAAEKESLEMLKEMPQLSARLPQRNAFADIMSLGMLHLYHRELAADPNKRILAGHIEVAVREASRISSDIPDVIFPERHVAESA